MTNRNSPPSQLSLLLSLLVVFHHFWPRFLVELTWSAKVCSAFCDSWPGFLLTALVSLTVYL